MNSPFRRVEGSRDMLGMAEGHAVEISLLGNVNVDNPEYQRAENTARQERFPVPLAKAVEIVRKFQPWDPTNPRPDFLRELRLAVAEQLGANIDANPKEVTAYTAVGTPMLDRDHGVDAFMISLTPDGKEVTVTLDVTIRDSKIEMGKYGGKADVIIDAKSLPEPTESRDSEKVYLKTVNQIARQIVELMQDRSQTKKTPEAPKKNVVYVIEEKPAPTTGYTRPPRITPKSATKGRGTSQTYRR